MENFYLQKLDKLPLILKFKDKFQKFHINKVRCRNLPNMLSAKLMKNSLSPEILFQQEQHHYNNSKSWTFSLSYKFLS